MQKRTVNIDRFIGCYDGYIPPKFCEQAILVYEEQDKFQRTINRLDAEKTSVLDKTDQQHFITGNNIDIWWTNLKTIIANYDQALHHYLKHTGVLEAYGIENLKYTGLKIQKTLPTEGYHVWHLEHGLGFDNECRALVFSIYLNDVEEGGETEFLHFSKRIKPKAGRIVIWPAGFPYVHRGNPPLSGEKYLLTSWMTLR
jgi:hypothetical protein